VPLEIVRGDAGGSPSRQSGRGGESIGESLTMPTPESSRIRFLRTDQVMELCGLKHRSFWAAIADGSFPKPDAYLGPRRPVWTDETITRWQLERLEQHREQPQERRNRIVVLPVTDKRRVG